MSTAPPNKIDPNGELQQALDGLSEDKKIARIMQLLGDIRYGALTIVKHSGKIITCTYNGEVRWQIPEFKKKPGEKA